METFGEKVKKNINYNGQREILIKFPHDVYTEFSDYSKEEAADCYWLAIKRLMDDRKAAKKYEKLSDRVDYVESLVTMAEEEPKEREIPSFGRKGDKK